MPILTNTKLLLLSSLEHSKVKALLHLAPLVLLAIALHLHLLIALAHNARAALPLAGIFLFVYGLWVYKQFVRKPLGIVVQKAGKRLKQQFGTARFKRAAKLGIPALFFTAFIIWLLIDSSGNRIRLRSLLGFCAFLLLCYAASAHPAQVRWQPVIGGIILQVLVGFIVLRWPPGTHGFQWFAQRVVSFLDFSAYGTRFVYGFLAKPPNICGMPEVFVFSALQIIVYFGAVVALLYHFGIIQAILCRLARIAQCTIGTTPAESLNAAACIFLGQTEAAILIGPSLASMTRSEIHAVMSAGFACIAGSLFAAYISFGACSIHLLSGTIMNAAISLGVSKLVYPELEESKHRNIAELKFAGRDEDETIVECISKTALHTARFVLSIAANLLVYIALLALFNALLAWAGSMVGIEQLSFNALIGYCFFPLAWAMGASDAPDFKTSLDETMQVAELMGVKTVLNEFIAYQQLSQMVSTGTLKGVRAKMIATYAMCGFSNISMIGSQIGILSAMCPERKSVFARVAFRAFLCGVFSCFLTACVAGMLVDVPITCQPAIGTVECLQIDRYINSTTGTSLS